MVMGYFNAKVGNDNVGRDHVMGREGVQAEEIKDKDLRRWFGKKELPNTVKGSPWNPGKDCIPKGKERSSKHC